VNITKFIYVDVRVQAWTTAIKHLGISFGQHST